MKKKICRFFLATIICVICLSACQKPLPDPSPPSVLPESSLELYKAYYLINKNYDVSYTDVYRWPEEGKWYIEEELQGTEIILGDTVVQYTSTQPYSVHTPFVHRYRDSGGSRSIYFSADTGKCVFLSLSDKKIRIVNEPFENEQELVQAALNFIFQFCVPDMRFYTYEITTTIDTNNFYQPSEDDHDGYLDIPNDGSVVFASYAVEFRCSINGISTDDYFTIYLWPDGYLQRMSIVTQPELHSYWNCSTDIDRCKQLALDCAERIWQENGYPYVGFNFEESSMRMVIMENRLCLLATVTVGEGVYDTVDSPYPDFVSVMIPVA